MLDFSELSTSGVEFELLIREIIFQLGYRVEWSGIGPDGGRDLVAYEEFSSPFGSRRFRWLIQCKHFAHSRRSVGVNDLDSILDSCSHHNADGYLLVSSTFVSSAVCNRLDGISQDRSKHLIANFWDSVTIERLLSNPETWSIAQRFLPKSANAEKFEVSRTTRPNHFIINFRGHHIHFSNRIGSRIGHQFSSIKCRLDEISKIELFENQFLQIRSIYYDDKSGSYHYSIDYMMPYGAQKNYSTASILRALGDGYALEDGQCYTFDVIKKRYSAASDHYDRNHYDYYVPYMGSFLIGEPRYEPSYTENNDKILLYKFDHYRIHDSGRESAYNRFCSALKSSRWIEFIRSENAEMELIDEFPKSSDLFTLAGQSGLNLSRLTSCLFVFQTTDEAMLIKTLEVMRQDFEIVFLLKKGLTCLPFEDRAKIETNDEIYFLEIRVNFYSNETATSLRTKLNLYLCECADRIDDFISRNRP